MEIESLRGEGRSETDFDQIRRTLIYKLLGDGIRVPWNQVKTLPGGIPLEAVR